MGGGGRRGEGGYGEFGGLFVETGWSLMDGCGGVDWPGVCSNVCIVGSLVCVCKWVFV